MKIGIHTDIKREKVSNSTDPVWEEEESTEILLEQGWKLRKDFLGQTGPLSTSGN
jgi:hypothetical protein